MKINKRDVFKTAKNFLLVVAGTVVLAFGTSVFILPFDLVVGGISSYAIIIDKLIPFDILWLEYP